jgi:hypothetical protein
MFAILGLAAGSWQGTDLRAISAARNTFGFSVATHSTIRMRSKLWATLARDAIRFIEKYQKKDTGEIFHELSQSAGLINWFKDYPYAYGHTDVSAMYLVAFRNLYRASGDIDFVRSSWDSIKAAYRYLVTRVDPSDGLVTIPAGGWGGDETVSQQVAKDVYLESVWVAGAEALKGLANLVGDRELAGELPEVSRATFIASSTSACLSRSGPRASSLRRYCVAYSAWSPTRTALSSTGRRTCRPVGPVSRSRICKSGAPRWPSK